MVGPTKRGRAKPGRVLVVETPGEAEEEAEEKTEQERAADEVVAEATAANPRIAEAIINRLDPDTGEEKWVAKVAASLISNEWLARKFGGGKYRVQYRKPNATGKMVFGGQETYTIDPTVRPEPTFDGGGAGVPGSRNLDAIMEAGVMGLITQMQNSSNAQLEFMRSIMEEKRNAKSLDWVALAGALSVPMTALIEHLLRRQPDVMDKAKEIAELATKNQGATGGLKDFIGAFREMAEIRDLLGGGGGSDNRSTGERLLEAAVPKFLELADRYAVNQSAHAPAPGSVAVRPPATQPKLPAGTPPQPSPSEPMWLKFVANKIPQWVKLAEMDKDPELYAALEIDNLPPMFMGPLKAFLQRPDALDLVLNASPQLKQYEEWSREFFDEITALVLGDEEEDGDGTDEEEGRESDGGGSVSESGTVPESGGIDDGGVDEPTSRPPRRRKSTPRANNRTDTRSAASGERDGE